MESIPIAIRLLRSDEASVLLNVAPDVFDREIQLELAEEFLHDPRHHLAIALEDTQVVGMASAVHYVHPDKPPQLFINEVGVAPTHHRRGIGRQLIAALLAHGKALGCTEAWVSTEPDNNAARGLYAAAGGIEEPQPFVLFTFPLNS
jgi:ribosomal protein S18 acetylase RimI-like enzyme